MHAAHLGPPRSEGGRLGTWPPPPCEAAWAALSTAAAPSPRLLTGASPTSPPELCSHSSHLRHEPAPITPTPTPNEHCAGSLRPQDPQSPLSKHSILILSHHSTLWYLLFPPRRSFLCSISQECRNHMKLSPALFRAPPAPTAELGPLG